jgi:cytochrome b561
MAKQLHYGTTAKVFHWLIVALLIVQFPLGWFMPHIHHGMKPGDAMTFHISFGITILALIVLRFFWRITHPVAPVSSLPAWQQLISELVHWLLYALVFATTMTGWIFASERGWSISLFFATPLPTLRGGRIGAHVHISRPDHAADAAGEAGGRANQRLEAGSRSDEASAGPRVS